MPNADFIIAGSLAIANQRKEKNKQKEQGSRDRHAATRITQSSILTESATLRHRAPVELLSLNLHSDKRGAIPAEIDPILTRIGIAFEA